MKPQAQINILVVIDKLTLEGKTPSCIALNLRDGYPFFRELACNLTVCNLSGRDPGSELLRRSGLPVITTGGSLSHSPANLPALIGAARRTGAALIHCHGYAAANFGRLAGRRLRLPVVVHEHAVLRVRPHQYLVDLWLRQLTTRGVAISRAVAEFMVRGRGVPPERIVVIANGIELDRFVAVAGRPREQLRAGFGWPGQGPVIGSAARFRSEKGLDLLLAAVAELMPRHPGLLCVMAGEGPDRDALAAKAGQLGLEKRILFPGFIDDMPAFMRALTLLAIPSRQEGLSFAAMEAMAAGTPVVASRVGGLPEIVEDGVNGVLVRPGDSRDFASALDRLLTDPERRHALAGRASSTVGRFSIARYAETVASLYRELLF